MTFEQEVEFMEKEHKAGHHKETVDRCAECYKKVSGHDLPLSGLSEENEEKLKSIERSRMITENPLE